MKLTKVVFTDEDLILNNLKTNFKLKEIITNKEFEVFEWFRELNKEEEEEIIVVLYKENFTKALKYIKENYSVFKIIIAWWVTQIWNFELKTWDIIIPNTYIKSWEKESIFIEYAIWENYDLKNFWLVLSWVCLSWDINSDNEFIADICDNNLYDILQEIEKEELLDKTVSIKWIEKDYYNNIVTIIEIIL